MKVPWSRTRSSSGQIKWHTIYIPYTQYFAQYIQYRCRYRCTTVAKHIMFSIKHRRAVDMPNSGSRPRAFRYRPRCEAQRSIFKTPECQDPLFGISTAFLYFIIYISYVRIASRNRRLAQIHVIRKWPPKIGNIEGMESTTERHFQTL